MRKRAAERTCSYISVWEAGGGTDHSRPLLLGAPIERMLWLYKQEVHVKLKIKYLEVIYISVGEHWHKKAADEEIVMCMESPLSAPESHLVSPSQHKL